MATPGRLKACSTTAGTSTTEPMLMPQWQTYTPILGLLLLIYRVLLAGLPLQLLDLVDHGRNHFQQIIHNTVVSVLEYRGVGVLVDRDHHVRSLHSRHVLERAADAEGQVELGLYGLARDADLAVGRKPAGVHDGAASRDIGAQQLGEVLYHRQVLVLADTAADRDQHGGLCDVHVADLRLHVLEELAVLGGRSHRVVDLHDLAG